MLALVPAGFAAAAAPQAAGASVRLEAAAVPAGRNATAEVTVKPAAGVSLYRARLTLRLEGSTHISLGSWQSPPGKKKFDEGFGEEVEYYAGPVVLRVPLKVSDKCPPGKTALRLVVGFQGCTETACFAPESLSLPLELEVTAGGAAAGEDGERRQAPAGQAATDGAPEAGSTGTGRRQGWLLALLSAFVAGLAVSFTPCVYPMIPITVALIGGAAQGQDGRRHRFKLVAGTLVYVLGISLTYAVLGALAAAAGLGMSDLMRSPAVPALVGAFMGLLAMSMFGAFDLQLPAAVTSRLGRFQNAGSLPLLLFSGAVLGLVASPCVSGPLAGLLTAITTSGDPLFGAASLFAFAWGMSALLLVAGIFPGLLARPGAWMNRVKTGFGIVLGLAGLYFARTLLPERIFSPRHLLALAGTGTILAALAWRLREGRALRRWLGAAGALALTASLYVAFGTAVSSGWLTWLARNTLPRAVADRMHEGRASNLVNWQPFNPAALSAAAAAGRPVVVDFYADWCTYCLRLDDEVFDRPEVAAELSRFTVLRVDASTGAHPEPVNQAFERFGRVEFPTIIILASDGREIWRGGWPLTAAAMHAKLREVR
jgi:thiol:disulfide interchange protein DsbD